MSPKRQNPDASNVYRDSESTSTLPLNPSKRPKVAGRPPLGNKDVNPSSGGPKSAGLASDAQSYEDIQKRAFNKKETDAIDGAEELAKKVANELFEYLRKKSPASAQGNISRVIRKGPDAAAEYITEKKQWTPELLKLFRVSSVSVLDLSGLIDNVHPELLSVFKTESMHFTQLRKLSLQNGAVSDDDVAQLRFIPQLEVLNLRNTCITTEAVFHLVCHKKTLKELDISFNQAIDNPAVFPLAALIMLKSLHLRETSINIFYLRRLEENLQSSTCRIVTLPKSCMEYLSARESKYCVDIPTGYLKDPNLVGNLSLPLLRKNLELHKLKNKDIQTSGTKTELVDRLAAILRGRILDTRLLKRMNMRVQQQETT